jgi:hypothetical protein
VLDKHRDPSAREHRDAVDTYGWSGMAVWMSLRGQRDQRVRRIARLSDSLERTFISSLEREPTLPRAIDAGAERIASRRGRPAGFRPGAAGGSAHVAAAVASAATGQDDGHQAGRRL